MRDSKQNGVTITMKKIITTLALAGVLTLGGGGLAAFADDAPGGDASSTDTTQATSPTVTPGPVASSDPAPSDQPTPPTADSSAPVATESAPEATPFAPYEVSHDWYAPRPATVANPFAVPQHSAVLTCEAIKQHDVYTISSAQMAADYAALLATDNLRSSADDAEFSPHDYTVTDIPALCPVPAQVCTTGGAYHESDDNSGLVTNNGVIIASQGDGKATDFGFSVTGNAQGFTTLDWTQTNVVGNGIFARLGFDLSADGGPAYASFSGLGTHIDQNTVAGYGSKAVFSGKSIADVATTWPHNKLLFVIWQTGSSYPKDDGAVLTSATGPCLTANFVTTTTTTTDTTGTAAAVKASDATSLAYTGVEGVIFKVLLGSTLLYLGASLRFRALRRPLRFLASKVRRVTTSI